MSIIDNNNFDYKTFLPAVAGTVVAIGTAAYCLFKKNFWQKSEAPSLTERAVVHDNSSIEPIGPFKTFLEASLDPENLENKTFQEVFSEIITEAEKTGVTNDQLRDIANSLILDVTNYGIMRNYRENGKINSLLKIFRIALEMGATNFKKFEPKGGFTGYPITALELACTTGPLSLYLAEPDTIQKMIGEDCGNCEAFYYKPIKAQDNKSLFDLIEEGIQNRSSFNPDDNDTHSHAQAMKLETAKVNILRAPIWTGKYDA